MDAHGNTHAGVGHVMRRRVLFRVLAALLILTYVTVAVTSFDIENHRNEVEATTGRLRSMSANP